MAADVSVSQELHAISGWTSAGRLPGSDTPEYTAEFLLGMLPAHTLKKLGNEKWYADHIDYTTGKVIMANSRTNPANALARLAIELFNQGVLLRR